MKNYLTNFKRATHLNPGRLFALLAAVFMFGSQATAQYCAVDHYYGCGYSNNQLYGAIEEVVFVSNGTELYRKAADGCVDIANNYNTGSHGHEITTTPTFALSYGASFSILMNGSGNYYTAMSVGIWIDLNRDGDFDDTGEWFGNKSVACCQGVGCTPPALTELKFSLPCGASGSGTSRIRIRSTYQGYTWAAGNSCGKGTNPAACYYGETEDYAVTLSTPSSLSAGFFMPDTAFIGTPVKMTNSNQAGYFYHGWDINDDGSIQYVSTNATHKFSTAGKYCVRLFSQNCLGRDSILRCITVVKPTQPPVADFVSDRNKVELYNTFRLTDLSTNGAIYWDWFMYQEADSAGTYIDGDDYADLRGNDETVNQNPEVFTAKGIPGYPGYGLWSIGLRSSNAVGQSVTKIKKNYIEVTKGCDVEMGPGTVTGIPGNVITCPAGTLKNKDNGSGSYSAPESNLDALVAPCGATSITFTFDQWLVKSNVNLKVYDGQNANGTPLHTKNGFNDVNPPTTALVAKTGALYFLWSTTGSATDKGWIGHWTSTIGSQAPPTAKFNVKDTVYNAVLNTFTNTSLNATGEVFYTWEIDGAVVSNGKDMEYTFLTNATNSVCLTVETCAGKNKFCKNVVVARITSKTSLDFTADNRRPKAGDKVEFTATADKANTFLWTFFPGNSVQFVDGTNNKSAMPKVTFSAPGKYTVSLKAWNNLSKTDSAVSLNQVIKDQYIIVIDYCKPLISVTASADVAINRVMMQDNGTVRKTLIDNESEESTYTDYTEDVTAPRMTFGGTYNLTISRNTAVNKMTRKVWVDWNIDGDFDDAGELVASEASAATKVFNASFVVPDLSKSFEGKTRMRVGVSYDNDPNVPCGASSGIKNANRIGEFEDYTLLLANDNTFPVITMNGNDTVYVELNKTYTDAGATATDPTEGDITSKMVTTSDIDITAAGIYYVTYCVKDASGNVAPCKTRVVYVVVDQTPPTLTLKGTSPVYVDVITGKYTEDKWTATDATDGNLETAVIVTGSVDVFKIGTYVLTYTVQDAQGNTVSKTRDVIVRDQVFPTITNDEIRMIGGRNVVNVQLQSVFVDRTVPNDNYNNGTFGPIFDYFITPSNAQGEADVDTRVKGTTVVTYTATDETGNETVLVIDYVVEDYIAPVISLNTMDTVYHMVNAKYTAVEPGVSDNLYNQTQVSLVRSSNVNPYALGLYTDTYTATDASGNVTVRNRWVRVYDGIKPVISGKFGPIARLGLYSQVGMLDYVKMSDNYDAPADLFKNAVITYNDVNFYEEGVYAVVMHTTDNSDNASAPFTLIVEVSRDYETISGINEVTETNVMTVYPNPSSGIFNVNVNLPTNEMVNLSVYDMVGNQIQEVVNADMQQGTYTIDISGSAAGVYFVRMSVHGQVINKKVVIK